MANQRTEAEALAICIEHGLTEIASAIRWADEQIAKLAEPHPALIDISLSRRANNLDVAHLLRETDGEIDWQEVSRRLVRTAADRLRGDNSYAIPVANMLHFLSANSGAKLSLPRGAYGFMYQLEDAAFGHYYSETEVIREMSDSLKDFLDHSEYKTN